MSQDVNMIILCDHSQCQYCHEGECGKDVLYVADEECEALRGAERAGNEDKPCDM